jgi:hypothetical protein
MRAVLRGRGKVRQVSRRPASVVQADFARIIRAAKQAGAAEVEVRIGEATILIRISTATDKPIEEPQEIVL